jgi:hypothetical protein
MSNRTVAIAFAAITGCASIFTITSPLGAAPAAPESAAKAADECLAAPKAATPAGAHWYYRIEKGTRRKCWYLADEGGKTKKAAAPSPAASDAADADTPAPTKITPPAKQDTAKKAIQKSVANARAELRSDSEDDQSLAETTWPPMPNASTNADIRKDNEAAATQPSSDTAGKQGWNVATRWPEPGAASSTSDQPAAAAPQPATALTPERLAASGTVAQAQPQASAPVPAANPGAVPQTSQKPNPNPESDEGLSVRILLSLLVGVLALAAILGPLLFKYFRPKPREDDRTYVQRRPIWDLNETSRPFAHDHPPLADEVHHVSEIHYGRSLPEARVLDAEARAHETDVDELEELLARAAKRPAA